jgi:hypothetical protein
MSSDKAESFDYTSEKSAKAMEATRERMKRVIAHVMQKPLPPGIEVPYPGFNGWDFTIFSLAKVLADCRKKEGTAALRKMFNDVEECPDQLLEFIMEGALLKFGELTRELITEREQGKGALTLNEEMRAILKACGLSDEDLDALG